MHDNPVSVQSERVTQDRMGRDPLLERKKTAKDTLTTTATSATQGEEKQQDRVTEKRTTLPGR